MLSKSPSGGSAGQGSQRFWDCLTAFRKHNLAPASYIDAWTEVSAPAEWSDDQIAQLKRLFAD
jgi:hypothetical protein